MFPYFERYHVSAKPNFDIRCYDEKHRAYYGKILEGLLDKYNVHHAETQLKPVVDFNGGEGFEFIIYRSKDPLIVYTKIVGTYIARQKALVVSAELLHHDLVREILCFLKVTYLSVELDTSYPWSSVGKFPNSSHLKRTRAKEGELAQNDVAKDFGVTRKTIIKWEKTQTEDGPGNTGNPYGYYKSLRTNPALRGAYSVLARQAKAYNNAKKQVAKQGKRFKITFVQFNEMIKEHNIKL